MLGLFPSLDNSVFLFSKLRIKDLISISKQQWAIITIKAAELN